MELAIFITTLEWTQKYVESKKKHALSISHLSPNVLKISINTLSIHFVVIFLSKTSIFPLQD